MKLKDLGEFELIELMARAFHRDPSDFLGAGNLTGLAVGIGDDAAVWATSPGSLTIATTDAMVEGTHFTAATASWYDLGWKAMASNISDIAGMGGIPLYALVVLGTSADTEVDDVLQMCQGMADMAWEFGASVVGGDTVSSPLTTISVTVIGETLPGAGPTGKPPMLSRFTARPGDAIGVTGKLGSSAGGLELMLKGAASSIPGGLEPLVEAHRRPMPRVKQGQALASLGVLCGMDVSDGIGGDLLRICRASRVAAEVEVASLPMDPLLERAFGERARELAFTGGEDYELLFTAPLEVLDRVRPKLDDLGTPMAIVGRIVAETENRPPLLLVSPDGRLYPPRSTGWEHFAAGGHAGRG